MVVVVNEVNEGDRVSWSGGIVDSWNDGSILVGNESIGRVLFVGVAGIASTLQRREEEKQRRQNEGSA